MNRRASSIHFRPWSSARKFFSSSGAFTSRHSWCRTTRDLAFGVADRIAVINEGRILTIGTPDEVKRFNDPLVQSFCTPTLNANLDFKSMKNSLETNLGYFAVLVVVAAFLIMETLGGMESIHGGYRLNALFDTVQDLKVGSSVKMAGVEIGRVEKIALAGNKVRVTMKLHSSGCCEDGQQKRSSNSPA